MRSLEFNAMSEVIWCIFPSDAWVVSKFYNIWTLCRTQNILSYWAKHSESSNFHFRQASSLHKIPVLLFRSASNAFLSWLLGLYGNSLTLSNSRWKGFTTSYNKPVQTRLSKENNTLTQCRIDQVEFGPKVCGLIRTLAFYV